jgi:threonine dehydrogenase-like Zn-dependent dehydrogenase
MKALYFDNSFPRIVMVQAAAGLISEKRLSVGNLITHRFSMDRRRDAVNTFLSKGKEGAVKIVLEHPSA